MYNYSNNKYPALLWLYDVGIEEVQSFERRIDVVEAVSEAPRELTHELHFPDAIQDLKKGWTNSTDVWASLSTFLCFHGASPFKIANTHLWPSFFVCYTFVILIYLNIWMDVLSRWIFYIYVLCFEATNTNSIPRKPDLEVPTNQNGASSRQM